MKTLRDIGLLLLIFGGIWAGFAIWSDSGEDDNSKGDMTFGQEEELADMMRNQIEGQYDVFEDSLLEANINLIFERLTNNLDSASYDFTLQIMESSEVNAFATFNGDVYMLTGLIEFAESPEEVAAVLAHEIGHHEKQHVQKKIVKELGLTVLLAIATGGDPGLISELFKLMMSTKFDREQETEADAFAHKLLVKSGIKPKHIASFFLRMKSEKKEVPKELRFISTHPANEDRIQSALEYELPEGFEEKPIILDSLEWEMVKERI